MDMKWTRDQFDTTLLGVPSYKSNTPLSPSGRGFFTCFVPVDPIVFAALIDKGFRLISVRNTYVLHDAVHYPSVSKDTSVLIEIFNESTKMTRKETIELARPIWEFSRYRRDTEIPVSKSLWLYGTWIANSFYHGYADRCFVVRIGKKIVGLCTVKIKAGDGYIDLLGILPSYQGKYIGSQLLTRAVAYLRERAKRILVVTEGENIPANRLYQKHGFMIDRVELVYHQHVL